MGAQIDIIVIDKDIDNAYKLIYDGFLSSVRTKDKELGIDEV